MTIQITADLHNAVTPRMRIHITADLPRIRMQITAGLSNAVTPGMRIQITADLPRIRIQLQQVSLRALAHTHRLFAGVGSGTGIGVFHTYRQYRCRWSV
jgi:hypothetical protein